MKAVETEQNEGGALLIRASVWTRMWAGVERGIVWGFIGMGGLLLMFSPDVLFDWIWGRVEGSPSVVVLILSLGLLAGVVGLIGGMVRALRRDVWIFDPKGSKLVFQTRPLVGSVLEESVALSEVRRLEVQDATGLSRSRIRLVLADDRPDETLVTSRFGAASIRAAGEQIEGLLNEHGIDLDIRYASTLESSSESPDE